MRILRTRLYYYPYGWTAECIKLQIMLEDRYGSHIETMVNPPPSQLTINLTTMPCVNSSRYDTRVLKHWYGTIAGTWVPLELLL